VDDAAELEGATSPLDADDFPTVDSEDDAIDLDDPPTCPS
jgi:hypothetical protein